MTVSLTPRLLAAVALAVFGAATSPAHAQDASDEQQFVNAGLWIGLHAESAFDSAITSRLPSGTPLDVLQRQGGLARVRTESGEEGWIDEMFLSATPPAVAPPPPPMVDSAAVIAQRDALAGELEAITSERDALLAEKADLLAAADDDDAPANDTSGADVPDPALAELETLAAENLRLRQALGSTAPATGAGLVPSYLLDPSTAPGPLRVIAGWGLYTWLAAACSLMLAFFLGALLIQWDVRRRHGGFRI